jgi:hypothetical protein
VKATSCLEVAFTGNAQTPAVVRIQLRLAGAELHVGRGHRRRQVQQRDVTVRGRLLLVDVGVRALLERHVADLDVHAG